MAAHPEIQSEQAHLDRAYARLDAMREAAAARRDEVIANSQGGTHQAREERDVIVRASLARIEQLRLGDETLSFGRIDRTTGERFYIGRLAVSDVDQEPLIVDWRAPVAEPFYRATGRHPMGLSRRRHFITDGRKIIGMEDELLDLEHVPDEASLAGEGALLAALERSRSGAMRDIVGTIQAEQDDIIRAPMPGVLVVQGGPGTGKTAVALHRAAYLLYTYRFPLERQGVLVVGPNPLFLRYIEHVLPSLGETGVTLSTVAGLYSGLHQGARPTAPESPAAARVKGDVRMAKVLARAVADRQRPLRHAVEIPYGSYRLRLTPAITRDVVAAVKRRPGTHNGRRPQVEQMIAQRLHSQYAAAVERATRFSIRTTAPGRVLSAAEFAEELHDSDELRTALQRMWPLLLPEELVHDLFGAPPLIELATRNHLSPDERETLHRPRSASIEDIPWTAADIPLLDEAAVLLGPRKRKADADPVRTFGHVVVDEAQDLSPMQLRMLARRSLGGSMTVVGDIGQATGPFSPSGWGEILAHLPNRRPSRQVELTVNYRTPVEIMEVASRVLAKAAPHLVPPRSVRAAGVGPSVRPVQSGEDVGEVALAAAALLRSEIGGSVAVICPSSLAGPLGEAKEDDVSLENEVSVVPVASVKGLEFDGIVVVEPSLIAEESPQGLRALYVSLTRATKRLTIVHREPLPPVLGL